MPASNNWNTDGAKTNFGTPFSLKIGNTTTIYSIKIDANITNGKVSGSRLTLQDKVTGRGSPTERALATSTDGGKTWIPTKSSDGKPVLTPEQIKSLQPGGSLYTNAKNASQSTAQSNGATQEQKNQLSNGNVTSTSDSKPSDSNPEITQEQLAGIIKGRPPKTDYGNLYYPLDIGSTNADVIKFSMVNYLPKTLGEPEKGFELVQTERKGPPYGTVTMSIQPQVTDQNRVEWSPQDMNYFQLLGAVSSLKLAENNAVDPVKRLESMFKNEPGIQAAVKTLLAGEAAGGARGLLTRLTGAIVNPNLDLLFTGPSFRPFTFTFKMSPREPNEAEQVKKIIRFFKQGMAVQRTTTTLFLKSPNVFDINYIYRGENKGSTDSHPFLPKIKTCALLSCDVNYAPTNSYMTFEDDGSMVSYEMTLQFQELEPVYEDEYGQNDNNIGY